MKKKTGILLITITAVVLMLTSAFTALASEYTIWDGWWDSDYYAGKAVIRWDKCEKSTKYTVHLFRNALGDYNVGGGKSIMEKKVTGNHLDVSEKIAEKGKGSYYFTITPVNSSHPLDDMYICQDTLDVDKAYLERIRDRIDDPSYETGWVQTAGNWKYLLGGEYVKNRWMYINNNWYYFGGNGIMLKGWQWINRRCYYLNPIEGLGGYPEGACWMGRITPDGYTVDASGAWTVNGIVQIR